MSGIEFKKLCVLDNPMETDLYCAALRESDIPHRARRTEDGAVTVEVAAEWFEQAEKVLKEAEETFFGTSAARSAPSDVPQAGDARWGEVDDGGWLGRGLLSDRRREVPRRPEPRKVWPARVLALLPGVGLGHLYAGQFQMFIYLVFASLLGVLFYAYTKNPASFGFNLFAWVVDLVFAPYHVKEHNRRAMRMAARNASLAGSDAGQDLERHEE
ncbi:MAG: hypothetical protein D6806_14600 [Deltaproteobacteria bacterium]|nr:MAG: hypothetical protein D6806_14600 [Deltaproteobacteria bacterium]